MTGITKKKILIIGGSGFIGRYLMAIFQEVGIEVFGTYYCHQIDDTLIFLNVLDGKELMPALYRIRPDIIIHCAALTNVKQCETDRESAIMLNVEVPVVIARYCSDFGARMIFLSTDLVFSGKEGLYTEESCTDPVNFYGYTKALAEERLLPYPMVTIVRTSLNYGYESSFVQWMMSLLQKGQRVPLFIDEFRNAVYAADFARSLLPLLVAEPQHRFYHNAASDAMSRYEWGVHLLRLIGHENHIGALQKTTADSSEQTRPRNVTLVTSRYEDEFDISLPTVEESLREFIIREGSLFKIPG